MANNDEREAEAPKTLPADTGGIDIVTQIHPANQAVAPKHRADDARGQSPIEDERVKTRLAQRRSDCHASADGSPDALHVPLT